MGQILYRGARTTEALCRFVRLDVTHYTIRHKGRHKTRTAYTAPALHRDGKQEAPGLYLQESEGVRCRRWSTCKTVAYRPSAGSATPRTRSRRRIVHAGSRPKPGAACWMTTAC